MEFLDFVGHAAGVVPEQEGRYVAQLLDQGVYVVETPGDAVVVPVEFEAGRQDIAVYLGVGLAQAAQFAPISLVRGRRYRAGIVEKPYQRDRGDQHHEQGLSQFAPVRRRGRGVGRLLDDGRGFVAGRFFFVCSWGGAHGCKGSPRYSPVRLLRKAMM